MALKIKISSKPTLKILEQGHGRSFSVFIVDFEQALARGNLLKSFINTKDSDLNESFNLLSDFCLPQSFVLVAFSLI